MLYLSLLLPLLLLSCSTSKDIEHRLNVAEELMTERPDSSLVVLEGINIDDIGSRRLHAKYALLLTQAKDKNYIDETDATLI